jgi:hypothetical protein
MTDKEYVREMLASEKDNIERAREICAIYGRPSEVALEHAVRGRVAVEALMDDEARARVAVGLPAWGPTDRAK